MPDKKIEKSVGVYNLPVDDQRNLAISYFEKKLKPTLNEHIFEKFSERSKKRFETYELSDWDLEKFNINIGVSLGNDIEAILGMVGCDENQFDFFDILTTLEYKIRGGKLDDYQKEMFLTLSETINGVDRNYAGTTALTSVFIDTGVNIFSDSSVEEILVHEQTHFMLYSIGGEYIIKFAEDERAEKLRNNSKNVSNNLESFLKANSTLHEIFAFSSEMFYGDNLATDNYESNDFVDYSDKTWVEEMEATIELSSTFRKSVSLEIFDGLCAKSYRDFIKKASNLDYMGINSDEYKNKIEEICFESSLKMYVDGLYEMEQLQKNK